MQHAMLAEAARLFALLGNIYGLVYDNDDERDQSDRFIKALTD